MNIFSDYIDAQADASLTQYSTWRVGGRAKWLVLPRNSEELVEVLDTSARHGFQYYVLGRGSNVLIPDKGLDAVVIVTKNLKKIERRSQSIFTEAGATLPSLSRAAAEMGFCGFEFLIGIPGTVGGGIAMNAGLTSKENHSVSDIVESVTIWSPRVGVAVLPGSELEFGYRTSNILGSGNTILGGTFRLDQQGETASIKAVGAAHLADRKAKQPLDRKTAGSTFKQPLGGKPAGWYIEQCSLKGERVGGAVVSMKHANWIENDGSATANDILMLISKIQEKVQEKFSVVLETEAQLL